MNVLAHSFSERDAHVSFFRKVIPETFVFQFSIPLFKLFIAK